MWILHGFRLAFAVFAAATVLAACGGSVVPGAGGRELLRLAPSSRGIDKIQHVVIIIQENRSLDNLFQGFPGARTQSYGYDSSGEKIKLGQIPLERSGTSIIARRRFLTLATAPGVFRVPIAA